MALKAVLSTEAELAALPKEVQPLYEKKDGKFFLAVEGVVPADEVDKHKFKVAEFRDTNIRLMKELEELKPRLNKFEGVDPDEYKVLKAEQDKLKKRGLKDADDIDVKLAEAIKVATKPLNDELALIKEDRARMKRDLDRSLLRDTVAAVATKKGVKQKALTYVFDKAEQLFRVNEGKVTAVDGVKSQVNSGELLTPEEWLDQLAKTDDFLFEPSQGGGASPASGGGKTGAKQLINPSPEEMGRHTDAIAKGEMVVVRQ